MRTSLNDIKHTEEYLFGKSTQTDRLVFEARMILSPAIQQNTIYQQQVYKLVQAYGRKQLKAEIEAVHTKLFSTATHQSFRQKIYKIFRQK